jgi:two-component system phosphate regulon sensor histidine kinase PhoR
MQKKLFFMNPLQLARTMMWAAILLIVVFQSYWLRRLYTDEKEGLQKETNGIFRDMLYNLQMDRIHSDSQFFQFTSRPSLLSVNVVNALRKEAVRLKRDSLKAKSGRDTIPPDLVFMTGTKVDTVKSASPRRIVFSGNGMPPELQSMIESRQGSVQRRLITDTNELKKIMGGGAGTISVVVGPKQNRTDSVSYTMKQDVFIRVPDSAKDRPLMRRMGRPTAEKTTIRMRGVEEHSDKSYFRLITTAKSLDDSLPVNKVDSAYRKELVKANIPLAFRIKMGKDDSLHRRDTADAAQFATAPTTVGLAKPNWYQAEFDNPTTLLMRKISPQILFSLFLVAFTSVAFVFLYRNLSAQHRLTEMKNDFISNITHELKTPIATVSVAVEALRNFGGLHSPERTKEYLDISASELQRLGLLVDKVLKLSMFENRELELKKETFDLKELVGEVLNTMKLQFDKHHAKVDLSVHGHYFSIDADRLHITSVIYNLLDNALKYSKDKPKIDVSLRHETDNLVLEVTDKGIGIPEGYKEKIFDKFFRVPTGDHHNIKGYGLGLSYVSHVVKKHGGTISVESEPGKGSTFTVKLPIA